jgi:hypothetical protein
MSATREEAQYTELEYGNRDLALEWNALYTHYARAKGLPQMAAHGRFTTRKTNETVVVPTRHQFGVVMALSWDAARRTASHRGKFIAP